MHRIFTKCPYGITFIVYLTPSARKNCINGLRLDSNNSINVKISVHSKPIDNCANADLINFIAKTFDLPKTSVSILSGIKSRNKKILLFNFDLKDIPIELQNLLTQQISQLLSTSF